MATGKSYKIRHSLSCHTYYIIYCAICLLCNRQCVGSSVNFRARLSNHKSHIKQRKRTCRLVNHFIDNAHDHPLSSLKFVLIEKVSTKTEEFLEQRERYWQAQLWTYKPYGFNAKKELTLEDNANSLVDAAFCYHGRFSRVLDCTCGYQKGHVQQLSMGSKSFYLVI